MGGLLLIFLFLSISQLIGMMLKYDMLDNAKVEFKSPVYVGTGKKKKKVAEKTQTVVTINGEVQKTPPVVQEGPGVTFITPSENAEGQTATDQIALKNAGRSELINSTTAITESATGHTYTGAVETVNGKKTFVGFYQPTQEEKAAQDARIAANKDNRFYSFLETGQTTAKQRAEKVANNLGLKMALPISTMGLNPGDNFTVTVSKETIPAAPLTPLQKAYNFATTPIAHTLQKNKNLDPIIDRALLVPRVWYSMETAGATKQSQSNNLFISTLGKARLYSANTVKSFYSEMSKPYLLPTAFAGNVIFKGVGAAAKAAPLSKFTGPALNFFSKAASGVYVEYQALDVLFKKKTAAEATGETLATFAAFKLTEPAADFTYNAISSGANKAKMAYSQWKADKMFKSMRGDVGEFLISPDGRKTPINPEWLAPRSVDKGQLNLFNKPADLSLNEPKNPVSPIQTRDGYLKFGGKYATDSAGNRLEVSSFIDTAYNGEPGQLKLFKDRLSWKTSVKPVALEGGDILLNPVKTPFKTTSPNANLKASYLLNNLPTVSQVETQNKLFDYGAFEVFRSPIKPGSSSFKKLYGTSPDFSFRPGLTGSQAGPSVNVDIFKDQLPYFGGGGPAVSAVSETAPAFPKKYLMKTGNSIYGENYKPVYVSYPTSGEIETPARPLVDTSPKLGGGLGPLSMIDRIRRKISITSAPPKLSPDINLNLNSDLGNNFKGTPKESIKPVIIEGLGSKVRSGSRHNIINDVAQTQITEQQQQQTVIGSPGFNLPSFGFKKISFTTKPRPEIELTFPSLKSSFKLSSSSGLNLFGYNQPRAFRPSVRASFFGLKGLTSFGSIKSGLGERLIPKKFKLGGF